MKKLCMLFVICLLVSGCKVKFAGGLNLDKELVFVNLTPEASKLRKKCQAKALEGQEQSKKCRKSEKSDEKNTVRVPVGLHRAKVNPGKKEIVIKIMKEGSKKALQEFKIKVPKGSNLPKYSGEISISAAEAGKSFGLKGNVETDESNTDSSRSIESCNYTVDQRVCRGQQYTDSEGMIYYERECRNKYRTVYGNQDVEYYYHLTNKVLNMELIDGKSNEPIGSYEGAWNDSDKIYTFKAVCFGPEPRRRVWEGPSMERLQRKARRINRERREANRPARP
jgi:hypothetical protein